MKSDSTGREPQARAAETRRRLLEAAGEVFAEEGFRGATIQEISRRAAANLAAVHYHFGDKEKLYAAVIKYADQCAVEQHPPPPQGLSADRRLRAYIGSFLSSLFDRGRPAWHAKLMAREMIDPTAALDRLVHEKIRANHEQLAVIVRDLIGERALPGAIRASVFSIIGQCVFYRNSAPVLTRLYPELELQTEIESIADHVTRFSLAGIRGLARTGRTR